MPTEKATLKDAAVAELIGGPFDGHRISLAAKQWPEFLDMGLEFRNDHRRALYRFEPLANGTAQYRFDRRYTQGANVN